MYDGDNTTEFQHLLDGWAAGDDASRNQLLERTAHRLMKLTRRMLRGYPRLRRWEQTDDVFQTAVLKLYRSLSDIRPHSVRDFFALAATQIRRTLIDLARHHFGPAGQAARQLSDPSASGLSTEETGGQLACRDEPPETLDGWARFHEAVDLLPTDERDVFSLIWYGEATQKEAADLLGISERTVIRRLLGARLLLHETLKEFRSCFEEAK